MYCICTSYHIYHMCTSHHITSYVFGYHIVGFWITNYISLILPNFNNRKWYFNPFFYSFLTHHFNHH